MDITARKCVPGDITGLQVVYVREMLKRHGDERETLLGHLQDESLEDLVEAAATVTDDERQKRLIELQTKRQALNLTVPGRGDTSCYNLAISVLSAKSLVNHSAVIQPSF